MSALDTLIKAVEAGGDWIGLEASQALKPQQYADALRAYGEGGQKSSLDAARALHEALLPAYRFRVEVFRAEVWWGPNGPFIGRVQNDAAPARAWLLAILRAHRSQQGAA